MSDVVEQGRPWGMCAAYGCPLFGSMGSDGKWFCFCHINKPSSMNDAISMKLRGDECWAIVAATLDIRRCSSSFRENEDIYRRLQHRLITADRRDMLFGDADCSPERPGKPIVKMWLGRLEAELMRLTGDGGLSRSPTPISPIIGPTHAMRHYSEPRDDSGT